MQRRFLRTIARALILSLALVFASVPPAAARKSSGGSVHVKGYFRKNGTYVQPHYRSAPDGNFYNNWSTKGSINPYTGKEGTRLTPSSRYGGSGYTSSGLETSLEKLNDDLYGGPAYRPSGSYRPSDAASGLRTWAYAGSPESTAPSWLTPSRPRQPLPVPHSLAATVKYVLPGGRLVLLDRTLDADESRGLAYVVGKEVRRLNAVFSGEDEVKASVLADGGIGYYRVRVKVLPDPTTVAITTSTKYDATIGAVVLLEMEVRVTASCKTKEEVRSASFGIHPFVSPVPLILDYAPRDGWTVAAPLTRGALEKMRDY